MGFAGECPSMGFAGGFAGVCRPVVFAVGCRKAGVDWWVSTGGFRSVGFAGDCWLLGIPRQVLEPRPHGRDREGRCPPRVFFSPLGW